MRRRGAMREVLLDAASSLASQGPGGTWVQITQAAFGERVGPLVARQAKFTIGNMVSAGELAPVGTAPATHTRAAYQLAVYAPVARS